MASAQNIPMFEYQQPQFQRPTGSQLIADAFLGSNNSQNIASQNNLLAQQSFNQQAMNAANKFNKYMWDQQANYNTDKYNQTMAYNKYMAETQYQRAVNDMRKAGINPIVAFANGASPNAVGNSSLGSVGGSASSSAQSGQGTERGANILNGILGQTMAKFINKFTDKAVSSFFPDEKLDKILNILL